MTDASYFIFVEPAVPFWGKLSVYSVYFLFIMRLHIINIKKVLTLINVIKMLQMNTNLTIITHVLVYPTKD